MMKILLAFLAFAATAGAQTTSIFLGGPGNFSEPLNWDTNPVYPNNGQPGSGDTYAAIVGGGNVTLDVDVVLTSLDFSTASLNAVGTRTITAATTLGNGAVFAGGVTRLAGSAGLSGGASAAFVNIRGGAEVTNLGAFSHAQAGAADTGIILNSDGAGGGSTFRNASGATFTATTTTAGASVGFGVADAGNRFVNAGSFVKSGAADYNVNVAFENSGAVDVQAGRLALNAGDGGATTGSHAVAGTLALSGGFSFAPGGAVTGAGRLTNNGGTTTFASGSNLSAGTLEVVSGEVVVDSGATFGTANLAINGGDLTTDVDHTFTSAAFTNGGSVLGTGDVTFASAATFDGDTYTFGGTGTKTFATDVNLSTTSTQQFFNVNGGTEVVSSAQFTQARLGSGDSVIVLNADLAGGGSVFRNTGTFIANASGGEASIGSAAVDAGNQFINEGTFQKFGSNDYSANVAFVNSGTLDVQQGTMNLTAGDGGSTTGAAVIAGGTALGLSGGHTFATGSTVAGGGTLRVNGDAVTFAAGSSLTAGRLELVSGTTTLAAGSTLGNGTNLAVNGGTLVADIDHTFTGATFAGDGTVAGSGEVEFAGATVFNGDSYTFGGAGGKTFVGTAAITSGADDQFFNVNGGTTVTNRGSFAQTKVGLGENVIVLNSGLTGGGSQFVNAAGGGFTANVLTGSASVGFATTAANNAFVNDGTFTKTGAGLYEANVAFRNVGGVNLQQGTFDLNAGDGGATSGAFVLANGTTLGLGGSFAFGSGSGVSGAGTLLVKNGDATFGAGSSLGAGTLRLLSGTTTVAAGSTLGATKLEVAGGTLQLDIDHTFTGAAFSNDGIVTGSGAATFAGTTTFDGSSPTLGGSGAKIFTGSATVASGAADQFFNVNGGTEVTNSGSFTQRRTGAGDSQIILNADQVGGSSRFTNEGTFTADVQTGSAGVGFGAAVGDITFDNSGQFVKTGSGEYNANVVFRNNGSGSVSVQAGILNLNAGSGASDVSGDFAVAGGATLGLAETNSFASTVAVSGAGSVIVRAGTTSFAAGSSFAAGVLELAGGTTTFQVGSTIGATALRIAGGTLESNIAKTFSGTAFTIGGTVTGSGATTFSGTTSFDGNSYFFGGSGTKTFSGTTVIASGATNQFINVLGGTEVVNTGSFTQRRTGAGLSSLVLSSNLAGPATFRNASGSFFTADVSTGLASVGFGAADPGNLFRNQGFLNKTGNGTYQVNVVLENTGTMIVGAGTMAATAGITGNGTVDINPSAVLDLSENVHTSAIGQLKHDGANLALGANDVLVSGDYSNANFGIGNSFTRRSGVTGTGQILAAGDAALAATGDASGGTIAFGTVHVGDTVAKSYALANTGTSGPAIRGALQTSVNGGNLTDTRLSGSGVTAGNFGPVAPGGATTAFGLTLTASTAGALTGQSVHVATNFDNVAALDLAITGAVNFFADPVLAKASGDAMFTVNSATLYTIDFGTLDVADSLREINLALENFLRDAVFQDTLGGAFDESGVSAFGLTGFAAFSGLASGGEISSYAISLDPNAIGNGIYAQSVFFDPTSTNGSGTWNLGQIEIALRATVVPEPSTIALVVMALGLLGWTVRRRVSTNR
jgi:hypothetical protein